MIYFLCKFQGYFTYSTKFPNSISLSEYECKKTVILKSYLTNVNEYSNIPNKLTRDIYFCLLIIVSPILEII